jgi:hypothetical protein
MLHKGLPMLGSMLVCAAHRATVNAMGAEAAGAHSGSDSDKAHHTLCCSSRLTSDFLKHSGCLITNFVPHPIMK